MKASMLEPAVSAAVLALASCASRPVTQSAPALGGVPARVVELPVPSGAGEPREVRVLLDEPSVKVVTIVLRGGTVLPEHASSQPVTIQALQGSGTVVTRSVRLGLDQAHAVVLAPKVAHAVEPDPGPDLVLLVHHHGRGSEDHRHE
jgi:quercetin dioxygenase-like cupin family protein